MTAAEVKKRVDEIFQWEKWAGPRAVSPQRKATTLLVLDAIAKSNITRSTTRAMAEELRRLFE